jgi:hypothetical protein
VAAENCNKNVNFVLTQQVHLQSATILSGLVRFTSGLVHPGWGEMPRLGQKSTCPTLVGYPKIPASEWITSTNSASELSSFKLLGHFLNKGPAGSNPVILTTRPLLTLWPQTPAIWAPKLSPIKCKLGKDIPLDTK